LIDSLVSVGVMRMREWRVAINHSEWVNHYSPTSDRER
jgi:hypothetical protein